MDITLQLTKEFSLMNWQVENTIKLIDEGNTIPFIARYRKEAHGTLDDQVLRELSERLVYLRNFDKRKTEIFDSITSQEAMTPEIEQALQKATLLAEIEDIYRPFKPKRRTRASIAREKGLEGLAKMIINQPSTCPHPIVMAEDFVNEENEVNTAQDALQGAMDIISEDISDNANIRKRLRNLFTACGVVHSVAPKVEENSVYKQYEDYSEQVSKIVPHRILAIDRGEKSDYLKVSIDVDTEKSLNILYSETIKNQNSPCVSTIKEICEDSYKRLIFPSIEREIRSTLTETATESAIKVFSTNLRQLLMQPPVKGRVALGLDPGFRTGCKIAVVDETGKVLDTGVIYPTINNNKTAQSKTILKNLLLKYNVDVIAIGNGTASKETEIFTVDVLKELQKEISYMIVSEAGASVYSASKLAAEEFPEYDVSLRSAVSIARRLQDPLAELVKIDPKAIGVGQYQHDMPKKELSTALDGVVEGCVNTVGVDLNTASPSLLSHVAGVNSTVAKNIVKYREDNGAFKSRAELKKVPKLGQKAFEQCAGFLRVVESANILDRTCVHPESYDVAKKLFKICGYNEKKIDLKSIEMFAQKSDELNVKEIADELKIGVPTLNDIIKELVRPGRDPRDELPQPLLRTDILDIKNLTVGMELTGTVRNVIDFGAFVDIGVHQDGLVHISQIINRYIKHPSEVLKVGDIVTVWVKEIDIPRKRIALTMLKPVFKRDSTGV